MRRNAPLLPAAAAILLLAACQSAQDRPADPAAETQASALYFASPQDAVQRTTELLRAADWPTLARHYDLSGSGLDPASLERGDYFLREERPDAHHPGLPWQYERPFTPGMRFEAAEPTDRPGVVRVRVGVEIDQGGGPPQRGFETFLLRKTDRGYQLLPDEAGAASSAAPPRTNELGAADTALFRPRLAPSLAALPPATRASLTDLLEKLAAIQGGATNELPPPEHDPAPTVPGRDTYNPTDSELLASEVGLRIELVLETEPVAEVAAALEREWAGPMQLRYERIDIRFEDHAGAGRLYYALAPQTRLVNLPKAKTPH